MQSSLELTVRHIGDQDQENSRLKEELEDLTKKLEEVHVCHIRQLKDIQVEFLHFIIIIIFIDTVAKKIQDNINQYALGMVLMLISSLQCA